MTIRISWLGVVGIILTGAIFLFYMESRAQVEGRTALDQTPLNAAQATFAGGCFWCIEAPFDKVSGVYFAISGYTGGTQPNPRYEEVSSGQTDHIEAVRVIYDPQKITYYELLNIYWLSLIHI